MTVDVIAALGMDFSGWVKGVTQMGEPERIKINAVPDKEELDTLIKKAEEFDKAVERAKTLADELALLSCSLKITVT